MEIEDLVALDKVYAGGIENLRRRTSAHHLQGSPYQIKYDALVTAGELFKEQLRHRLRGEPVDAHLLRTSQDLSAAAYDFSSLLLDLYTHHPNSDLIFAKQRLLSGVSRMFQAAQGCQIISNAILSSKEAVLIDIVRGNANALRYTMVRELGMVGDAANVTDDSVPLTSALWGERRFDRPLRKHIGDWAGGKGTRERQQLINPQPSSQFQPPPGFVAQYNPQPSLQLLNPPGVTDPFHPPQSRQLLNPSGVTVRPIQPQSRQLQNPPGVTGQPILSPLLQALANTERASQYGAPLVPPTGYSTAPQLYDPGIWGGSGASTGWTQNNSTPRADSPPPPGRTSPKLGRS